MRLFQVTYRNGIPLVAYLNLPAVGERVGRPHPTGDGFIVDRDIEGKPFGVEILDPRVTLECVNQLLLQLGQEPLSAREWAPMLLR